MFVRFENLNKCHSGKYKLSFENAITKKVNNSKTLNTIIGDIYNNRPAGLVHAQILSKIVKRSIRLWRGGQEVFTNVKRGDKKAFALEAEYRTQPALRNAPGAGHWTLRDGKSVRATGENSCLYEVIASQTGLKTSELKRQATIVVRRYGSFSVKAALLAAKDDQSLLGGARYLGTGPDDAKRILDNSQYGHCHPHKTHGHPRGHAYYHEPTCRYADSVMTYSYQHSERNGRPSPKTAFLSRRDQDMVCHQALLTYQARDMMAQLNEYPLEVNPISRFIPAVAFKGKQPMVQQWLKGVQIGSPGPYRGIVLIGMHHYEENNNQNADIFILSIYPVM